jgi:hypothetical protein
MQFAGPGRVRQRTCLFGAEAPFAQPGNLFMALDRDVPLVVHDDIVPLPRPRGACVESGRPNSKSGTRHKDVFGWRRVWLSQRCKRVRLHVCPSAYRFTTRVRKHSRGQRGQARSARKRAEWIGPALTVAASPLNPSIRSHQCPKKTRLVSNRERSTGDDAVATPLSTHFLI